jgi:hypothetical protein
MAIVAEVSLKILLPNMELRVCEKCNYILPYSNSLNIHTSSNKDMSLC